MLRRFIAGSTIVSSLLALGCRVEPSKGEPPKAQPSVVDPQVVPDRLLEVVAELADDDMHGRYSLAAADIDRAAGYIADAYRAARVPPVGAEYEVPYELVAGQRTSHTINAWFEILGQSEALAPEELIGLAHAEGKVAFGPASVVPAGATKLGAVKGRVAVMAGTTELAPTLPTRVGDLALAGARGLLLVGPAPTEVDALRASLATVAIPVAWAKPEVGTRIQIGGRSLADHLATADKVAPIADVRISMAAAREPTYVTAHNVLAYLPGTDLAEEIVLIGAHYDHIGTTGHGALCRTRTRPDGTTDDICNGADDNASGTAAVLEVARAFTDAGYRPRRSIVFAHFSGEELGLHGSAALARRLPDAPPFQGGHIVAMINLDMIGRLGDKGLAVGGISSSDDWMPLLRELGDRDMKVLYERAVTSRSDHANFYRLKVPVLFFFTGVHPDYHGPGDELAAVNAAGMTTITDLVLDIAQALGDGMPIAYAGPRSEKEGEVGRLPGTDPETIETLEPTPPAQRVQE